MYLSTKITYLASTEPRRVKTITVPTNIQEVAASDAPVAFIVEDCAVGSKRKQEYLWYNERIWLPMPVLGYRLGDDWYAPQMSADLLAAHAANILYPSKTSGPAADETKVRARVEETANSLLIIDGMVYGVAIEPLYRVGDKDCFLSAIAVESRSYIDPTAHIGTWFDLNEEKEMQAWVKHLQETAKFKMPGAEKMDEKVTVLIPEAIRRSGKAIRKQAFDRDIEAMEREIREKQEALRLHREKQTILLAHPSE